jgi:hypothetical protein
LRVVRGRDFAFVDFADALHVDGCLRHESGIGVGEGCLDFVGGLHVHDCLRDRSRIRVRGGCLDFAGGLDVDGCLTSESRIQPRPVFCSHGVVVGEVVRKGSCDVFGKVISSK